MDFNSLAESIWTQLVTVWNAPVPFITLAIAIWFLVRWHFSSTFKTRMDNADSTIALQDRQLQDYKDKLDGATPDEAKARLDALEARIDRLGPRSLSNDKRDMMSSILDKFAGSHVVVSQDMAVADAKNLAAGINAAFQAARWSTEAPMVMGIGNPPASGIGIKVSDPNNLNEQQHAILSAFKAADIEFTVQKGQQTSYGQGAPVPVAEIIVTSSMA